MELTTTTRGEIIEKVLIGGDLKTLTPEERAQYYLKVCDSLELNPMTRPFEYIVLNGKLTLYARKDCTEQLRLKRKVSIYRLDKELVDGIYTVTAYAKDRDGREDSSMGAVDIGNLKGEGKANAYMKAETKAKRRVTLSICGLGFTDESEVDSIPGAVVMGPQPSQPQLEAPKALDIPSWSVNAGVEFLREYEGRAKALTTFGQLAAWNRQNARIAEKLGVVAQFNEARKRAWVRIADPDESVPAPMLDVPADAPVELYAEFSALSECNGLDTLVQVFKEHEPTMKGAGLADLWKSWAGQQKARIKGQEALDQVRTNAE